MGDEVTTCELCGEKVAADEIVNHLRLFHPDECGDGEVADELVIPDGEEPEGIESARITVVRRITADDVIDQVHALDGQGDDLPLTEALGMLRLAEDTLIRERMGEDE